LEAAQALEAVRQELWNQPRAEPWQLERQAAVEPERELPAVQAVRQSAVPVREKAEEQRVSPAWEPRQGVKQELWQVVLVSEQQEPQASLQEVRREARWGSPVSAQLAPLPCELEQREDE
jgi:hypothetical protein